VAPDGSGLVSVQAGLSSRGLVNGSVKTTNAHMDDVFCDVTP
jgi:hypothetical protein